MKSLLLFALIAMLLSSASQAWSSDGGGGYTDPDSEHDFTLMPGTVLPKRVHPQGQRMVVLDGRVLIRTPERDRVLSAGESINIPANMPYTLATIGNTATSILATHLLLADVPRAIQPGTEQQTRGTPGPWRPLVVQPVAASSSATCK